MNGRSLRPSTVPTGSRRNDRRRLTFVQLTTSPTATRTPTLPVEGKHSRDPRKFYSAREALSVAKPPIFVLRSVAATRAGTRLFRMLGFARRNNDRHASVACWGSSRGPCSYSELESGETSRIGSGKDFAAPPRCQLVWCALRWLRLSQPQDVRQSR